MSSHLSILKLQEKDLNVTFSGFSIGMSAKDAVGVRKEGTIGLEMAHGLKPSFLTQFNNI